MLSISPITSAAATADYFSRGGREDYFSRDGAAPGQWRGELARELGLEGKEVTADAHQRVL
ncbi:MAG: relaxase domain-containing protein [Nitrospinae bacterium]|nr:relaxase domain-containing protein [Nitrospinota bacterium]